MKNRLNLIREFSIELNKLKNLDDDYISGKESFEIVELSINEAKNNMYEFFVKASIKEFGTSITLEAISEYINAKEFFDYLEGQINFSVINLKILKNKIGKGLDIDEIEDPTDEDYWLDFIHNWNKDEYPPEFVLNYKFIK